MTKRTVKVGERVEGVESPAAVNPEVEGVERLLMPASGRFKNAGILLPDELWTFRTDECPPVRVPSSLRAILETCDGTPSRN